MAMLTAHYFVSFVRGSFHLLVDPALELIRITEKLLQVEGIGQLGAATQGSLVKGIAAAQQSVTASSHVFHGIVVVLN